MMITMSDQEKLSTLALVHTPGIGAVTVRQLISYCGGASKVFETPYTRLLNIPGVGDKMAREILKKDKFGWAEREWKECQKRDIHVHFYSDPHFPTRLKSLYDTPIMLYSQGNFNYNTSRTVAIIGTRQVTGYGKSLTESIVQQLVPYAVLVVSGLAYGVDISAHKACLQHQIPTIGVMASGLNTIYPAIHQKVALEMQNLGGIVTENALDTKPDFMRFPARNRIIAGLSDVVIVVESAKRGGSLITVEFAQNYHREVFAAPGSLWSAQSEGCHDLIRNNKAAIFTRVEDMMESLNWGLQENMEPGIELISEEKLYTGLSQLESQVIAALKKHGGLQIDDLAWQTGLHFNQLSNLLLNLEFQGIVRALPGKKYILV
jgi:DNA processing protein